MGTDTKKVVTQKERMEARGKGPHVTVAKAPRQTVAQVSVEVAKLAFDVGRLENNVAALDRIEATLGEVVARLDAQRGGLVAAEKRIEDMALKVYAPPVAEPTCQHLHYSNGRDDCTVFCVCVEGGPVTDCDHTTVSLLPSRVLRQDEINPDELGFEGVPIEDLMDGGNVAATEALPSFQETFDEAVADSRPGGLDHDTLERRLNEIFEFNDFKRAESKDTAEDTGLVNTIKLAELGGDSQSTEQAILRIATRMFYLQLAENVMESQPDNRIPKSPDVDFKDYRPSRSGWVADAWSDESAALYPLLYQWVRERGWV